MTGFFIYGTPMEVSKSDIKEDEQSSDFPSFLVCICQTIQISHSACFQNLNLMLNLQTISRKTAKLLRFTVSGAYS